MTADQRPLNIAPEPPRYSPDNREHRDEVTFATPPSSATGPGPHITRLESLTG
ncbi:hypothetical protein FIBSPDRAFT_870027 [Athelia psychrophila]|uniref:Uncharacterized protein n=1 Tax=Athelia psychrophila TaxID=1759441 RepID=A0A166BHC4_9AGAM|nr:hypothetical protein FIBSPDRAFT_870027 [Fibularhizoctonia sp. CBS 109695]